MAFTNKPDKSLPELTSQRRLREAQIREGGPGSGPRAQTAAVVKAHGGTRQQTRHKFLHGYDVPGKIPSNHGIDIKPNGSWRHLSQYAEVLGKGNDASSLDSYLKNPNLKSKIWSKADKDKMKDEGF